MNALEVVNLRRAFDEMRIHSREEDEDEQEDAGSIEERLEMLPLRLRCLFVLKRTNTLNGRDTRGYLSTVGFSCL